MTGPRNRTLTLSPDFRPKTAAAEPGLRLPLMRMEVPESTSTLAFIEPDSVPGRSSTMIRRSRPCRRRSVITPVMPGFPAANPGTAGTELQPEGGSAVRSTRKKTGRKAFTTFED